MHDSTLYNIGHSPKEIRIYATNALADDIIPQLKTALDKAAEELTAIFNHDSPFARDLLAELLLHELVCYLAMDDLDSERHIRPHQLAPKYIDYLLRTPVAWGGTR